MMKGCFKNCLIAALIGIGVLVLAVILFFKWFTYTSPVNEAGREYTRNIRSYENSEITSLEDINERLKLLNEHYASPTFDKMQGGDRTEVSLSDIETLFGKADNVIESGEISSDYHVHQYIYDEMAINFHSDRAENFDEYVIEKYSGKLYHSTSLDQLFFEIINSFHSQLTPNGNLFELINEDDINSLGLDQTPTREIEQNGWNTWMSNRQYIFDNGEGDIAPEEFTSLLFSNDIYNYDTDTYKLRFMIRRYGDVIESEEARENIDEKKEQLSNLIDSFKDETERSEDAVFENQAILIQDLNQIFGNVAQLFYDFQKAELQVTWVILDEDWPKSVTTILSMTEYDLPDTLEELSQLEVTNIEDNRIDRWSPLMNTDDFIGQK